MANKDDTNVEDTEVEETQEQPETEAPEEPETPEELEVEEEPEDAPEEEEVEEEPPKSRRLQKREAQLEEKLKIHDLMDQLKQRSAPQQQPQGLNYGEQLNADPETVQQLEADRQTFGEQSYNQGLQEARSIEWKMGVKMEAPQVFQEYPYMNPKSSEYDPAIAQSLDQEYLWMSQFDPDTGVAHNPGISYSRFVEARHQQANRIAGERIQRSTKNIARQSAMTGLRPDGGTSKRLDLTKAPGDMSLEELYAVTGAAGPKK